MNYKLLMLMTLFYYLPSLSNQEWCNDLLNVGQQFQFLEETFIITGIKRAEDPSGDLSVTIYLEKPIRYAGIEFACKEVTLTIKKGNQNQKKINIFVTRKNMRIAYKTYAILLFLLLHR